MTDSDRFLKLTDLITPELAKRMLDRARRCAAAHRLRDDDHMLGAMLRHVASPMYEETRTYESHTWDYDKARCSVCDITEPERHMENYRTGKRYTCAEWVTKPGLDNVVHIHSGLAAVPPPQNAS
jgi:hypothetical protein